MIGKLVKYVKVKLVERKDSFHQQLMNEAYDVWHKHNEWGYSDFLENIPKYLSTLHLYAVVIGNLNYQVENGGWYQWYMNGYNVGIDYVQDALDEFSSFSDKAEEYGTKLQNTLEEALELLERYEDIDDALNWGDFDRLQKLLYRYGIEDVRRNHIYHEIDELTHEYEDLSSDEAIENIIMDLQSRYDLDKSVAKDIEYVLRTGGDPVEEIADIVYETMLWKKAREYQDDIHKILHDLDNQYYSFHHDFLKEFNAWLKHKYIHQ